MRSPSGPVRGQGEPAPPSRAPRPSRRGFVLGAAAAASAAAALGATACSKKNVEDSSPQLVKDSSQVTDVLKDFKQVDGPQPAASYDLALGTVPFYTSGSWSAALQVPAKATSANAVSAISLQTGKAVVLMDRPTKGAGWAFHEVRGSDSLYVWVEAEYATGEWVLLARTFSGGALTGQAVQLDRGTRDYDPPRIEVHGSEAIWLRMPSASGKRTAEHSKCYLWKPGDANGTQLYDSPGRFACAPQVSGDDLVIVPRVNQDKGQYYGMTAIDLSAAARDQVASLVLPQSVKPMNATYLEGSFAFSIEASYGDSFGALGQMGTFVGKEGGPYLRVGAEPLAPVSGKGKKYLVKVRSSHYLVDASAKTYAVVASPDNATSWGDYPAGSGAITRFATFATLRDAKTGVPSSVQLRLFDL